MRFASLLPILLLAPVLALGPHPVPDSADATYEQAIADFHDGDFESAVRQLEELLERNPSWAAGWVLLGQCHYLLDRSGRGDECFRRAKAVDPETDLFGAYSAVGQLLSKKKRREGAVTALERALEHAPASWKGPTSLQLAYSRLMAGQHERARRGFEDYRREFGADPATSFFLALACQKLGDYPCALDNLRESRRTETDDAKRRTVSERLARWSHYWALLPENRERRDELVRRAAEDTGFWLELDPDDPTAQRVHAETLLAAGRAGDVIDELLPVAETDAGNCAARTSLAKAYNRLERGEDAERWAREATGCDPSSAEAHVELAGAHIRQLRAEQSSVEEVVENQDRVRAAIASLEQALVADPDHSRAKLLLSDTRDTLERLNRAEAEFVARDREYRDDVRHADLQAIRQRCLTIAWTARDETREISDEEEAFYLEHDCGRYARAAAGNSRQGGKP